MPDFQNNFTLMDSDNFTIVPFQEHHQADIDLLMAEIEKEFDVSIYSPYIRTIKEVSLLSTDKYWIALSKDQVIGTIGLSKLDNNTIALKRMFVNKKFRGEGIAKRLLDIVIKWADDHEIENIYLGTMNQFIAAQKFYEKHGFMKIFKSDLPGDFLINPVDSAFYKRSL